MKRAGRKALSLLFPLIILFARTPMAAEWSAESTMNAREEVNDNLMMTADPHPMVRETLISPSINMGIELENLAFHGIAALTVNRFDGANDLDTIDQNFNLMTRLDASERTIWTLNGGYLVDSTLGTELINTGVVLQRTQRNNGSLSLGWRKSLFEKTSFDGSYQWAQSAYVDPIPGLFNYHVDSGTAGITHELNDKSRMNGTLSYSVYHIPDQKYLSWDAGIRAGWVYSFSENLKGTFSGGFHRTGSSLGMPGGGQETLEPGWVLNSGLEYQRERSALHGGVSREVQISGGGSLVQVDRLSGGLSHSFTERSSVTLGLDLYRTIPFREELPFLRSNYGQIRGEWNWQWMERWEIGLGYSFSIQKNDAVTQPLSSNIGYFKMAYSAPKWALSR